MMVDGHALLQILILAALLWVGATVVRRKLRRLPPGPFPLPILGNLLLVRQGRARFLHRSLAKLAQRYGPIMFLQLGSKSAVVISSADLAREVLQTQDQVFATRPPSESAKRIAYGGDKAVVAAPYGADWREMKKIYNLQMFTARRVQEVLPVIAEEIKLMLQDFLPRRGSGSGIVAADVTASVNSLLVNIICRILFGQRFSHEVHDCTLNVTLNELVREASVLFNVPMIGDAFPYLGFLDYKSKRVIGAAHTSVDTLLEAVVAKREKAAAAAAGASCCAEGRPAAPHARDFLDVLLAKQELGRERIKAVILEVLVAGIDTTSVTLDWAMAELLANPRVLTKLQEEIVAVVGRERMVEMADLPNLIYTKAVVKETFRKHIPVPLLIPHMSTQACNLGGYKLPPDTRVFLNVWAISRDPHVWGENPEEFLPERFIGERDVLGVDVRGQHFELLPFGSGRRACPAIPLALPILELALSNLVHTFHWELPHHQHTVDMAGQNCGFVITRAHPLMALPSLRVPQSCLFE